MTACFIGHRTIDETPVLRARLWGTIEELIRRGVTDFLFGDHSAFNTLCYGVVSELQGEYPHVRRIYYRAGYAEIGESVKRYFLAGYEDGVCPKGVAGSGKAAYVQRNRAMIRDSDFCVFYFDEQYRPRRRASGDTPKSGTRVAFEYARKCGKTVINLCEGTPTFSV